MKAAFCLMLTLLTLLAGCGGGPPDPVKVEARAPEPVAAAAAAPMAGIAVETVREETMAETIRVTGRLTVNENRSWHVGAVTEGRVVKVFANPGDFVKEGQVLARMHSHDVHEGRAIYRKAVNDLARTRAAEGFAKQVRDRAQRLYDLKAAALEQVERAESEVKNAQAGVEQSQAELERARTHLVDFLQVTLDEAENHAPGIHTDAAHGDDDLIPVKAPASGTLLERKVSAGTVVAAAAEMFAISDLTSIWMQAAVPEASIARIRTGMPVRVEVQAHPGRSFGGRVTQLGNQLDAATRTLPVRIELANPSALLRPEMYADAEFAAGGGRATISVAEAALQELKGQTVVFVEKPAGQYEARAVETGRSSDGRVAILHGLTAGDRVVVKGAFVLKSQLLKKSLAEE